MRLAISCGGTGGHFYPGLGVARELRNRGEEVILLLSGVNSSRQAGVARAAGVEAVELPLMPSPGWRHPMNLLRFGWGMIWGVLQSRKVLRGVDGVLGMGSFASFPPLVAGWLGGIPVFLHDGNARVGRANRILSRIARGMWTAFPAVNASACRCRVDFTGMPIRPELRCADTTRAAALAELREMTGVELRADLPTILIFGGSQGAQRINEAAPLALKGLTGVAFQAVHLAGPDKCEPVTAAYAGAAFPYLVLPSTERMDLLYAISDLAVCRSGGSTVAELARFRLPAILIPYPYASENHQYDNARFYEKAGAVLDNSDCTAERLTELMRALLAPEKLRACRIEAEKCARPDAALTLLDGIARELGK